MAFKKVATQSTRPVDPESLFRDLPGAKNSDVVGLWSHQADILREYNVKYIQSNDIAIELPTGTGKTLVGLLIGEYRRRKFDERILYLCPTRQLANQVQNHAIKYGIKSHVFVGRKADFSASNYNEYISSEAIGISTYSGLFNTNPKFKDANVIILDDAHASENYIVSLWSVEISRQENKELFLKIISLFEDKLSNYFVESLREEKGTKISKKSVDMIPAPTLWERLDSLRSLIEENTHKSFLFPWLMIRESLAACNIFISWNKILIRPWIPPSLTHSPFADANQRIYMSATLGESGELERIIGVPKIKRLPVPAGWDKQGSGRRFFVFPNQCFSPDEYTPWIANRICNHDRTLVLCPDKKIASFVEKNIKATCQNVTIFNSNDIENSLEPFINNDKAALILTNRYDGIDLPDDTCRQVIIVGNPDATNLQEKFLQNRLAIFSLLKDRIITRFTQATGRCTRGIRDYSLVIPVGGPLHQFCIKKENLDVMHPELQAELLFGTDISKVNSLDELSENIDLFFEQGDDWKGADQNIRDIRQNCNILKDYRQKTLIDVVKDEVDFQYSLWKEDYQHALESAQKIVDKLSGDDFKGYRALWYYFIACVSWNLWRMSHQEGYEKLVKDNFERSKNCINTTSWFSDVVLPSEINIKNNELNPININSAEIIQENIIGYGLTGKNFDKHMDEMKECVCNDNSNRFEHGLEYLGNLLGFISNRPNKKSSPDCIWQIKDSLLIIFEAKSEENEEGAISVRTCRESKGHYDWAQSNIPSFDRINKKYVVIVTPRTKIDELALPHSDNLYFIHISHIRNIFENISRVYRRIRSQYITYKEEEIQSKILEELISKKLDPESLIEEIESAPLKKMPQI